MGLQTIEEFLKDFRDEAAASDGAVDMPPWLSDFLACNADHTQVMPSTVELMRRYAAKTKHDILTVVPMGHGPDLNVDDSMGA